ncbi:tRNA (adenosine(37)-N6)-dimethylallyltransferase MiaA [bacterium]|nr:tRNA (adenosine(37)-N6)-dimethylallyltransferase MiaA [bacterium]
MNLRNKVLVIVGPTASGKSEMAVKLAKKFNGEVISADSRQVYRGMDIGTGKVPILFEPPVGGENTKSSIPPLGQRGGGPMFYKGVRHYLINVASPKRTFTVVQYQRLAKKALNRILKRGKLPIIAGGTGFYINALVHGQSFPPVSAQPKLRRELEKLFLEELFERLEKMDPDRASEIDKKNKRRLIRALEVVTVSGQSSKKINVWKSDFQVLKVGILVEQEELRKRIEKRFDEWIKNGFLDEVRSLREPFDSAQGKMGLSWKRIESFGLNYRAAAEYLQQKISKEEMKEKSLKEIYKYAKRQMTWFRKDKSIKWVRAYEDVEKFVTL